MTSPSVYSQLGRIIRESPRVRDKVNEVRDRVASVATGIAATEAPDVHIETSEGVRPGTHAKDHAPRMYARVSAPTDQEWGTRWVERIRILGRAVIGR